MKDRANVFCKHPCEVSSWVCLEKLESFKSNAWRFALNLSNGLSATVCGVPQPIDLSTAIPHPLWRRNKHPNRVIRRGFYPVRVVQQENDRQHRFSLRGSHHLIRLVGAPNESLRLIIIYYLFKYSFGNTTTLLGSLRSQNTHFRARFRQTGFKDLVFVRAEFLSVVGAQNESLRLIIIYYIKWHNWDLNNSARFTSEVKNQSKGSI